MTPTTVDTLPVPGASLYYKVQGSGPLLLMLQGGDGDAEGSDGVAAHLIDRYTVVSYDRRGLSRSKLDSPEAIPVGLATHGEDAHRLLEALTSEPAFVFGSSIGALISLDLVARHPEQVHTLVAHEAPTPELLTSAERTAAEGFQKDIEETFRREGAAAAMKKFMVVAGDFNDREPDVQLPQPNPQRAANLEFFLAHDAPAVRLYRLDIAALTAAATHIVVGAGLTDREAWTHHCASALAERLGAKLAEFPGGHNGYALHPRAFAARLDEILTDAMGS